MITTNHIGPYMGIDFDEQVTFDTNGSKRTFRVATYQAFNAYGLIGPEQNGVVIFDEDNRSVLCDRINEQSSGYFGVSWGQNQKAKELISMDWSEFQTFINNHNRSRNCI